MAQTSQFHASLTAMAQAQEILRSDFSLEDKLMKLSGLMHLGDTLKYSDKTQVSRELSSFLPRLAALAIDKTNASDILMKNVLWQMLTHVVILNDLLEKSEETFLSFVSTLFQLGFNSDLPWLFREGVLSCLTELETTYPGLLVRALPRIYRTLYFEKSPAVQSYLVLFSLILNHCCVLAYDIALEDLKQEIGTITPKSSPQKNKQDGGVKLSFKYVVSYRVFRSKEPTWAGYKNEFQDTQMLTLLRDRINLCSPVAHSFVRQMLKGFAVDDSVLSNNLLYLFNCCSCDASKCGSLALLSNSDFLSLSFKHMMLSWYLSFISSSTPTSTSEKLETDAISRAAFCNSFDISFKQLVCTMLPSSDSYSAVISTFETFTSTDSESLFAILRYMIIASQAKNDHLVKSLSNIFISHMFRSRKIHASAINSMACEALEFFKQIGLKELIDSFSQQLEQFCFDSRRNRKVARLLSDFLPTFKQLAFLRLDFNKTYVSVFCDLITSEEKKRFGMTTEKASDFLYFFCSFLAMNPQYSVRNLLGENRKMQNDLAELDCDIARLTISLITYSCANSGNVVPCSDKFLVTPVFRSLSSEELKWTVSQQPVCEYTTLEIPLSENVESLSEFIQNFTKISANFSNTNRDIRFVLAFDPSSSVKDKIFYALTVELFVLSPFLNIDRKMVGSYAVPVVDFNEISEGKLSFSTKLEGLSEKIPYHEKIIARISFSTASSTIFASWLTPFTVSLTDALVPLELMGDHRFGNRFVSSLAEEVQQKVNSDLGWVDSVFRTKATPEKLTDSPLHKFVLLKTNENWLVGGFVPPSSFLFINFRFHGASVDEAKVSEDSVSELDSVLDVSPRSREDSVSKQRDIRDFVEKYSKCCFAFIFTNNALLLRHIYLLLESSFPQ